MSASAIVHVCTGGGEVPVDDERRDHRREQRRPQPADHGNRPDQQEVEEHHRREVQPLVDRQQQHREQWDAHQAEDPAGHLAAGREGGGPAATGREEPLTAAAGDLVAGDHVHVDRSGAADHPVDHRPTREHLAPAGPARGAEQELGRVLGQREAHQALGRIGADDLVVGAAEVGQHLAMVGEEIGRPLEPGVGADVDPDELGVGAGRHPRRPPDQGLAAGRAGHGHDDALPRLPRPTDAVGLAVDAQRVVDAVGGPQQGELAQRREVPDPEVVGQRGIDLVGAVDVPVGHPPPQGLGRHVDQLDLVGGPNDLVGNGLLLQDAGDLLDHVVHALEVLDVHGRDHVDTDGKKLLDVLPPLGVPTPGHVGVGQLVDQGHIRATGQHGVEVHLLEVGATVLEVPSRNDLEVAELIGGLHAPVGLDVGHDDVGAPLLAAPALVEHGERLADAWRSPEVDPQLPSRHA